MMEGANSLNQQDPIGIQNGLVPGNQEEQPSSLQGVNLFASQHRPLKDDGSYLLQAEQYVVPVSQGISTQDSENNMVSSQAPERTENPDYDAQLVNLQKANDQRAPMSVVSNQQALTMAINNQEFVATGIGNQSTTNTLNREMLFRCSEVLLAILFEHDKDRAKQLSADYLLLTKRVISEDEFLRCMISIAREPMIKAAYKMPSQQVLQLQPQVSAQQQNLPTPCTVEMTTDSGNQAADNSNRPNSLKVERLPDSHGMQLSQMSSSSSTAIQDRECTALTPHGLNKQKPQHMHFSHASFSTHGNIGSVAMNANNSASPLMQQSHDSRMRPIPDRQIISPTQLEATTQGIDMGLSYFSSINVGQGNILLGTLVDEYLKMNSSSVGFSVSASAVPSNPVSLSMPNHMDTNNSVSFSDLYACLPACHVILVVIVILFQD
ncbi:hypothetical protein ACH5RR_001825 [Cinchona calisaya]|uniref:Uncharacterized protein n=1 Tax=Cinchona calisaya TaxID=153742 RepID=A0ABD3B5S8_9GENT